MGGAISSEGTPLEQRSENQVAIRAFFIIDSRQIKRFAVAVNIRPY